MAPVILLDTHVLVWLYAGLLSRIPAPVQRRLNREQLALSPFAQLELGYLYEIGRVTSPAQTVIDDLTARLELVVADVAAASVCSAAIDLTWTRDPFDRLLAAHATVSGLPLVTRDETIRQHLPLAWWEE
jgi:PIN domain nuclease of toxin-antitoxin system